eukprot:Amastigsp_a342502_53.p4 type:complete len:108 gc:universal Amastigsp_a342502_53:424-101(-)
MEHRVRPLRALHVNRGGVGREHKHAERAHRHRHNGPGLGARAIRAHKRCPRRGNEVAHGRAAARNRARGDAAEQRAQHTQRPKCATHIGHPTLPRAQSHGDPSGVEI